MVAPQAIFSPVVQKHCDVTAGTRDATNGFGEERQGYLLIFLRRLEEAFDAVRRGGNFFGSFRETAALFLGGAGGLRVAAVGVAEVQGFRSFSIWGLHRVQCFQVLLDFR